MEPCMQCTLDASRHWLPYNGWSKSERLPEVDSEIHTLLQVWAKVERERLTYAFVLYRQLHASVNGSVLTRSRPDYGKVQLDRNSQRFHQLSTTVAQHTYTGPRDITVCSATYQHSAASCSSVFKHLKGKLSFCV
ncbi:uncharacterized protein LOC127012058 [Drosophila biarmipes]|uniref:uncharacterized protein LOC127012058 n=1 Tax=Drosophila biarmipes TaxID=125945 RepID=UPI0021CCD09E|nr:uncharacterized protein LOC127012058 [Drosophila biarmipes]